MKVTGKRLPDFAPVEFQFGDRLQMIEESFCGRNLFSVIAVGSQLVVVSSTIRASSKTKYCDLSPLRGAMYFSVWHINFFFTHTCPRATNRNFIIFAIFEILTTDSETRAKSRVRSPPLGQPI